MLVIEGLEVDREGFPVLRDIHLAVGAGTIQAVLGRNGAGKTTLVEAIMGLVPVRGGRVLVDGADVTGLAPERVVAQGVALVPEGRKLFPNLTVRDHLALGCRHHRWFFGGPPQSVFNEIWALFPDLQRFELSPVSGLSGGQRQMVALGRALVSRPRILLLDEPSFGLSPQMVEATMRQVVALAQSGLCVVLVEQNVDLVLDIAGQAALLANGRIVADGAPAELMRTPAAAEALFGAPAAG